MLEVKEVMYVNDKSVWRSSCFGRVNDMHSSRATGTKLMQDNILAYFLTILANIIRSQTFIINAVKSIKNEEFK